MVRVTMTQRADRFFGGGFGLAKGVVLTAALLFLIHWPRPTRFSQSSMLVPLLEKVSEAGNYIPRTST